MSCPKVLLSQELFAPALILVGKTSVSSSDCVKNQMSGDAWGKKKKRFDDVLNCSHLVADHPLGLWKARSC